MKKLLNKRYFVRILSTLLVLSAVLVLALTSILSANFRAVLRSSEYRNSMNSLSQVSFGRESMDMLADNLGRILCSNSYVIAAMTSSTYNPITSTAALNVVNTVTIGTAGIDSICYYNVQQQRLTSSLTGETVGLDEFYDTGIRQLVDAAADMSGKRLPILRHVGENLPITAASEVYSYVYPYRTGGGLQGVIIINFKTSLLSEMILALSERGNRYSEDLFAVDTQGNTVIASLENSPVTEQDRQAIVERCLASSAASDAFEMPLSDGQEHLVTFSRSEEGDWTFISLSQMTESLQQMRGVLLQTVLVAMAAFAVAAAVAVLFAKRLYSPIENLKSVVKDRLPVPDAAAQSSGDELGAVSQAFSQMVSSAEQLEANARRNRHQLQNTLKAKLLRGELAVGQKDVQERLQANDLAVAAEPGTPFALMQLKIDHWEQVRLELSQTELEANNYGILNVASELLAQPYHAFGAYMGEGRFCFFLNLQGCEREVCLFEAAGAAEQVQAKLREIFGLSLSAALTGIWKLERDLAAAYAQLQQIAQYSFLTGYGSVVDESVLTGVDNEYYLVGAKQKKNLIEAVRQGRMERVHAVYQEISDEVSHHDYQNMLDTYLYLAYIIYSECFAVEIKGSDFSALMLSFMGQLSQKETRGEIDEAFSSLFDEIGRCIQEMNQKQTPDIVEQVTALVQQNYADKNLCLNQLAQQVDRSAAYVGRMFKEKTDRSVAEYILAVRMQHLKQLLDTTDLPLPEILDRVGMEKNNYFYTLFRKHFGVSFASYARGGKQDAAHSGQ